jgi:curved DNA-binding protein CbpA
MIQTVLVAPEYIAAAKQTGVYASLLGYVAKVRSGERPQALPGEQIQPLTNQIIYTKQTASLQAAGDRVSAATHVAKGRRNEKALTYFQNCLRVLGLEEEVALTEELLKKAYKKAALAVHPDKGGNEQEFEAVTRAHAYLGEILQRIRGGRTKESVVEAPAQIKDSRTTEAKRWEMVEPVRLNPNKLDLNAFNQMFEQTRMPDPDDEGYGDWLKGSNEDSNGPKFGGKFNRDVFNRTFEEEARKRGPTTTSDIVQVQPQMLSPMMGVELGRERAGDYTAAPNSSVKYTDLRQAYTNQNTFSQQVAGVKVEARAFDEYSSSRKKAPEPLPDNVAKALADGEAAIARSEKQRQIRAANEMVLADQYFERMKQLVITNK